ncbi:MAG TPA: type I methionyl aminopeptidase [Actinomycetota bacterium]|nr:type I methionyl aminopeptidase [Actinomycetota bacterium]
MIIRKSPQELEKMRRSGRILADTIDRVLGKVEPGISTLELDRIAEASIREQGAVPSFKGYRGFPASICASINSEIVHGIPSKSRILEEADVVSLDFGAIWEGFHSDSAVTVFVGGIAPNGDAERLVKTTEAALDAAIAMVEPGGRLSDIGNAIETVALREGLGVVREYGGHGIGRAMHEDPFIQNWGPPGRGPELRPGLVIAVEPMLNLGEDGTRVLGDGWTVVTADGSLSAHFEHTVAVTREGHEVLTARTGR